MIYFILLTSLIMHEPMDCSPILNRDTGEIKCYQNPIDWESLKSVQNKQLNL